MSTACSDTIFATTFQRADCHVGVVHVGFGAFHRAHQAVYIDDYMEQSGDLRWGIAAVNLRGSESAHFMAAEQDVAQHDGYFLKTISPEGAIKRRRVRSHVRFADWSVEADECESLLSLPSVRLVTVTVTESGYYTDPDGQLNLEDPAIKAELAGQQAATIYGYLRNALSKRVSIGGKPLTIACCDNIRKNGHMLRNNLLAYLRGCDDTALFAWVEQNVAFPCSMVDRITPRSPAELAGEFAELVGKDVNAPVMAEEFCQWVLQSESASDMPDLASVGVTLTADVDPYEETKIRVLNGGHTALTYLAALQGVTRFDAAMRVPRLLEHFQQFENSEVLPALTIDLPFSKNEYLHEIERRFGNAAIGDTVARICADGMVKFPIFIRPTLEGCLLQGIVPHHAIRSIASWHTFARHFEAGNIGFHYDEPGWDELKPMLGSEVFLTNRQLWGDLPERFPVFVTTLRHEIAEMESKWPV